MKEKVKDAYEKEGRHKYKEVYEKNGKYIGHPQAKKS